MSDLRISFDSGATRVEMNTDKAAKWLKKFTGLQLSLFAGQYLSTSQKEAHAIHLAALADRLTVAVQQPWPSA